MEQENGNYLSLKAINQSVDDIRARNRSLERDLYNIIKLFHLYQRYIEHKIDRARNANEMALEFFSALDTEVNGVIRMVEESDLTFKNYTSSNKKTQQASSRSRPDSREPQTGISKDSWRKNFSKKSKEDTASTKIMNDLMINKDQMVREIQESQSSLNYILDYLRSLSFVKGQKNQNGSEQNSDSNRSVTSEPDPSKLLAMTDVDQFLIKTSNFFSNQKVPQEQDKSLKAYLVRIADLQKELKKKDNELELLRNQVSVTSPEQEAELRQLTEIIETLEDENKRLSEQNEGNAEDLNIAKMEAEANNKAAEDLTVKNEIYEKALEDLKNEKDDIEKDANQVKERMAKLDDEMNTLKAAREDAEIMREHLISIEASYKELLKEYGEMKEREVQSEALRKKVEQRLMEVDVIMEAIKEKNELIESANNDLVERNNYLEDRMANQRKDHGVVYEENCYLKTKMMESEKAKRDKGGNMLDLSGSQDMNLMIHEDFQRLQDDNIRLGEEVEMLRKRLFTLNEDNKNLNSHNKELRGRSRGSVGPVRGSINGAEDLSKNQYSPVLRQNQADHDSPDYLNIIFSQAIAIELLSSR